MIGNVATGGSGTTAGNGQGGGINLGAGSITVQNLFLTGNAARGGTGSAAGQSGNGSGGGAFAGAGTSLSFSRSSVIGNSASGGSTFMGALAGQGDGGGIFIETTATVLLNGSTFVVGNRATTQPGGRSDLRDGLWLTGTAVKTWVPGGESARGRSPAAD